MHPEHYDIMNKLSDMSLSLADMIEEV